MSDFGIYYPTGHMVVALGDRGDAERVQRDLLTGGYDPADCLLMASAEVAAGAKRNLADHTGLVARLGTSDDTLREHLDAARDGDTFLLIYAPTDAEADRAMNVVRRVPFHFAHRYRRFAIQDLK